MSLVGTAGKVLVLPESAQPGIINPRLIRIRANPAIVHPQFLAYYLRSNLAQSRLEALAQGGTMGVLNAATVGTLPVPLPSLAEQEAIASCISDVDQQALSLERSIDKAVGIKLGMMQQLVTGRTRVGGASSDNGMTVTRIGEIPMGWSVKPLANLVDPARSIRYGIVQPGEFDPSGRYMIRGQDYSEAKGWAEPNKVFRVGSGIEARYRKARVRRGDLIMTIVGYAGHVEMVPAWLDGANLTQTTARIAVAPDRANPTFCKYVLQSDIGKRQVATYLKGAAQPGLNIADVAKLLVCLPPMEEQLAIANMLGDSDQEIELLRGRLRKARDIKAGMMQQLITGRTRLPAEEPVA